MTATAILLEAAPTLGLPGNPKLGCDGYGTELPAMELKRRERA